MVMSCFQGKRTECKIESSFTIGRDNKIDHFSLDGFCSDCSTVFEAMGCFYHFCSFQEVRLSLIEEVMENGSMKRELDELRRNSKPE